MIYHLCRGCGGSVACGPTGWRHTSGGCGIRLLRLDQVRRMMRRGWV